MIFKLSITILASIFNINYSYATNIISLGNSYVICNDIRHSPKSPKSPKGMNNHQFSSISNTIVSTVNNRFTSTLSSDTYTSSTISNLDYYNLDDNMTIINDTINDTIINDTIINNTNTNNTNTNNTNTNNVNDDSDSFQPKIVIAAIVSSAFVILSFIGIMYNSKKKPSNITLERVNSGKKRTHNQDMILNDSYEDSQGYLVPNYSKRAKYNEEYTSNDDMYEQISEIINDNNDNTDNTDNNDNIDNNDTYYNEVDNTDYYINNEIIYNLADSINQQPIYNIAK
jgi:hypothetical protein